MHAWMANRFLLGEQLFRDRGQAQTWREKKVPGSMSNVRLDVVEVEKVVVPHSDVPGPASGSAPWVDFCVTEAPDEAWTFLLTGGLRGPSASLAPGRTMGQKPSGGGGGSFSSPLRGVSSDIPGGRRRGSRGPAEDIFSPFVLLKAPEVQGPWNPHIP